MDALSDFIVGQEVAASVLGRWIEAMTDYFWECRLC